MYPTGLSLLRLPVLPAGRFKIPAGFLQGLAPAGRFNLPAGLSEPADFSNGTSCASSGVASSETTRGAAAGRLSFVAEPPSPF